MAKEKKSDIKQDKLATIENICKLIQKEYGKESITYIGNDEVLPIQRITTTCTALDEALGGGFPVGRIIELYGAESSGKSTVCYHALATAQQVWPDIPAALVDVEYSFDAEYCRKLGVKVSELLVAQPDDGTDALNIIVKLIESGVKFIVVDSVAALLPKEEVDMELEKAAVGIQARLMSRALRKLIGPVSKHDAIIVFTNQTREKVGVMYGDPTCVTPDTLVELKGEYSISMADLFSRAGLNYLDIEKNVSYPIEDTDIRIKSYNHQTNMIEYKKVLSLIRKDNAKMHRLVDDNGRTLLKCSGAHRVCESVNPLHDGGKYCSVVENSSGVVFTQDRKMIGYRVQPTDEIVPILDLQVEDNHNYFTNGLLSHNTTPGGKALRFYASVRIQLSKIGGGKEGEDFINVKARVKKNKTAVPFREAEFVIRFGKGIDEVEGLIQYALDNKIIEKAGAWFKYDGESFQGKDSLRDLFEKNKDLAKLVRNRILNPAIAPTKEELKEAALDETKADELEGGEDNIETGEI